MCGGEKRERTGKDTVHLDFTEQISFVTAQQRMAKPKDQKPMRLLSDEQKNRVGGI